MPKTLRKVQDKWRLKNWYNVYAPSYFGSNSIASIPCSDESQIIERVIETTLYDITGDFSHQNIKLYFQIINLKDGNAETVFKGHEYSRDYLRSLVKRGSTRIDLITDLTTKDGYTLRVYVVAFSLIRIKTTKTSIIRNMAKNIVEEKGKNLTLDQFVQEITLGKLASDIYNEVKKIVPLRHVGVRKSKLLFHPKKEVIEEAVAKT